MKHKTDVVSFNILSTRAFLESKDTAVSIALITSGSTDGGVGTVSSKLDEGLRLDGFEVERIALAGNFFTIGISDLGLLRSLMKFDTIIYLGSFAHLSHFFTRGPKTALFVHGFVKDERLHQVLEGKYRSRIGGLMLLSYGQLFNMSQRFSCMDFYIGQSETVREMNAIRKPFAELKQFLLPREILSGERIGRSDDFGNASRPVTILVYLGSTDSPRLLTPAELSNIIYGVRKKCNGNFRFIVIDPKRRLMPSNNVEVIDFLPRKEFLRVLLDSDMYFERCVDEELGFTSIEAALYGIPVAKITLGRYKERCDYNENEILTATSLHEMSTRIASFIENARYQGAVFGSEIKEFVSRKRTWDAVKEQLIAFIDA